MTKVTAVALLAAVSVSARAGSFSSTDQARRNSAATAKIFRAAADRVNGAVSLCVGGGSACREVFDGRPLREGDVLKTGQGARCDVVVEHGGRLRVLENTEVKIGSTAGKCGFKVVKGAVLAALEAADCEIDSAQAAAATRDSRFRLDFGDSGVARFVVSDSAARIVAKAKPRALLNRWWAGKAPTRAKLPEGAAGSLARRSGVTLRAGEPLDEGDAVRDGDELETAAGGWATVMLAEGFAAVLDETSKVSFQRRDGRPALTLLRGRLYVARLRAGSSRPPLVTAGASSALEGSDEFEVSVDENSGLADFAVYAGQLAVSAGKAAAQP